MKPHLKKHTSVKKGFVLLYAVVIASIVLAVGISIMAIARKQITLSGLGRESQYAFYAANTGTECALFWDLHGYLELIPGSVPPGYSKLSVFPSPLTNNGPDSEVPLGGNSGGVLSGQHSVICSGTKIMLDDSSGDSTHGDWTTTDLGNTNSTTFTVHLDVADPKSACAIVTITKELVGTYELKTVVDSRGYNTCDVNSPRRVERGLRYNY